MKYIVDIDGTICDSSFGSYYNSKPLHDRIAKINQLYDDGHHITYWTARGGNSGIDWSELTEQQLSDWSCKYHKLLMKKPVYDLWIDDKAINSNTYFNDIDGI
jgi:hypothetical protein